MGETKHVVTLGLEELKALQKAREVMPTLKFQRVSGQLKTIFWIGMEKIMDGLFGLYTRNMA